MKKNNATTAIVIALLSVIIVMLVGIIIFTNHSAPPEKQNEEFTKFSETYSTDEIDKLTINADYGDIVFVESTDGKIHIEGDVSYSFSLTTSLLNGSMIVTRSGDEKKLNVRNHFDLSTVISLPAGYSCPISADTDYGNITAKTQLNGKLDFGTDYGNIDLDTVEGEFDCSTDYGNITINSAVITAASVAESNMGNITIRKTNPVRIIAVASVGTSTVNGSDDTSKITLKAKTDMGTIDINK